jgi:hypothetical protein
MPPNIIVTVLIFVIVSVVVGVIAKFLNSLAEANAMRRAEEERQARAERMERAAARARAAEDERAERPKRPVATAANSGEHSGGTVRPANSDMDRFLAEIDRLRRKAAANPNPPQSSSSAPVAPVVQPTRQPSEKPRARVVAELAEPPTVPTATGFGTSPQAPARAAPVAGQIEDLPVATVLRTSASTGAPATRVTRFASRPRPASKTNFGKNLTAMLASGQGVAMAVVLQEILGPPKSKRNAPPSEPPTPQSEHT